ncbi:hypothetical protein [Pseudoteredinibacter isoporae]|uniref:Uncharacterized protein n=1 Tax=Pseudoteredinibacter isoporae TaxID=570281 RepID=A0A7X0JUG2_9GAMM|nr:hypothetical protein [Pseudoteredinibacter isoporae]MBB6522382.1 hypothetical protein [Pseudoteredinibacter isoporae]NHO87915.1 hypothetical protein [Pseudoteredinibacter isoporae]NIB23754.1 hypothetical protein [Pseudoteredinibacter isoporae]
MQNQDKPQFASLQKERGQGLFAKRRFIIPTLSVLALLLIAVVFWLPDSVDQQEVAVDTPSSEAADPQKKVLKQSPWQDAQLGKQRRAAQDILAKLLESQESLETQQVLQWGEDRYQQAAEFAKEGDQYYRQQEFELAMSQYESALQVMEQLLDQVDEVYAQHMESAQLALEKQNLEQAKNDALIASNLETSLASHKSDAESLLQRIEVADEVYDLIRKGRRFERQQDWTNAQSLYQQAQQLDPENQTSQEAVERVANAIVEKNYTEAMSQGYQALETQNHSEAERWFKKARQIKQGDSSAASALSEAKTAKLQATIKRKLASAGKAASRENWQAAVDLYQQVQKLAPAEVSAKIGLIEAQARLQLDQQLSGFLEKPETLQDSTIQSRAKNALDDAAKLNSSDERLNEQLAELKVALIKAQTPVAITFRSDGQTEVRLLRHENLGLFSQIRRDLPPGRYTLLGQRKGYRDVRVNFEVHLNKSNPPIEVVCQEII